MKKPNKKAMQQAVQQFLLAAGLDLSEENLIDTPKRVTDAWADEFLAGYQQQPSRILQERFSLNSPSERELVVVTHLRFQSMCPHHLLPYAGVAHIAYVPGKAVVGFGRLATLLAAFSQRLILQEALAQEVAGALMHELKSQGAACILEAEQTCLRLRGELQHDAVTHAEAYKGVLAEPDMRREVWARIPPRR